MLALFDFPNANSTSEARIVTNVPLQRLFFMNSPLLMSQVGSPGRASGIGRRSEAIEKAYRLAVRARAERERD